MENVFPEEGDVRATNARMFPKEKAEQSAREGCDEDPPCYQAKPDGDSGRWMAFRVCDRDCEHAHHKNEVWLAS